MTGVSLGFREGSGTVRRQAGRYEHDRGIWDSCAQTYERRIVRGHPDVTDYEHFEHTLLDRIVTCVCRDHGRIVHLYDFGCGSGRLHCLFGSRMAAGQKSPPSPGIAHVGGIDFSRAMIELAERKVAEARLDALVPGRLSFDVGSAFDVPAYEGEHLPFAVSLCNSVGVMQGPEGARRLFEGVRRYVEKRKGVAVVSGYKKESVASHALGNYESTLDVCGQPRWLEPDTYASSAYVLRPCRYKRPYDPDPRIEVDVFDPQGNCVRRGFVLRRNRAETERVVASGVIDTYAGYHSQWYSLAQFRAWIEELWPAGTRWHIDAADLDALRGAPAQLAVLDYSGIFQTCAGRWKQAPLI
jgi:SAM-dependent methyltransferase